MSFARSAFSVCLLLLASQTALADWELSGAQYSCAVQQGEFRLIPSNESSSDAPGTMHEGPGFTRLRDGTTDFICKLGRHKLAGRLEVWPPANGQCEGAGGVRIESISVDRVELFPERTEFDWACTPDQPALESVEIKALNHDITLTQCFSQPPPVGSEESKGKCNSTTIDVDAAAAAIAKSDSDLAPLGTQQAEAAGKLPPGNDLAPIFGNFPRGSQIPLCAHWFSVFSGAHDSYQRHGRIAGSAGEHVPFHRAHPQLCARTDDDGCNSNAFLLPGQRIDVGFICGQWAYVQYETRVRTKPWTTGWIETARLYAVDPLSVSSIADTLRASPSPYPSDELLSGVWRGDIAAVKRLIADGHNNVDGTGGKSAPLTIAARSGNLNMAKELLSLGASPGSHDSLLHCSAPLQGALIGGSRAIIDLIIKARVDVNCRESAEQWTPLMSVARAGPLFEIDQMERGGPHYAVGSLIVGTEALLAARADPNARDAFGATALFITAEQNNVDVADVLMHNGADVSIGNSEGITPLMQALKWYSLSWDPTLFRMLLENGADPNHRGPSTYDEEKGVGMDGIAPFAGQTALTKAAEMGYFTLARLLLEHGAAPDITRSDGMRAADIAHENKHEALAVLIAKYTRPPR